MGLYGIKKRLCEMCIFNYDGFDITCGIGIVVVWRLVACS